MLTIRSLVDTAPLGLQVLVDGGPGAHTDPLLWLHNTELLDPSGYLRERELVLTNGLWHDGTNAEAFVANVGRAGGAGIVFGLREATPRTPDDLVQACARAAMPLLELPVAVPFTDVTRAAAAELAERRQESLSGMVRRGNALADAISRGSGAVGVLKVLRRDHNLPLVVVDRTGHVLAAAGASLDERDSASVVGALRRHPPPLEIDLPESGTGALFLVTALGSVDAALVCLRRPEELNAAEHDALTQAAHYLSLEVARIQLRQAMEARFAGELLEMISSGAGPATEVAPRLHAFGIDAAGPMAVLASAMTGSTSTTHEDLAANARDFFPSEGLPALVAHSPHDVVAIVAWNRAPGELAPVAQRMIEHARRGAPGARLVVGLSGPANGVAELRRPVREAREAARVLRRRPDVSPVARFSELGTFRLLLGGEDHDTLRRLSDSVLQPVRDYDARHGGQLEVTLRAFLDHDAHWSHTARGLYVHVNTLRNRLAKVTELTGRDVATTAGRVDVFLALEAQAMIASDE